MVGAALLARFTVTGAMAVTAKQLLLTVAVAALLVGLMGVHLPPEVTLPGVLALEVLAVITLRLHREVEAEVAVPPLWLVMVVMDLMLLADLVEGVKGALD